MLGDRGEDALSWVWSPTKAASTRPQSLMDAISLFKSPELSLSVCTTHRSLPEPQPTLPAGQKAACDWNRHIARLLLPKLFLHHHSFNLQTYSQKKEISHNIPVPLRTTTGRESQLCMQYWLTNTQIHVKTPDCSLEAKRGHHTGRAVGRNVMQQYGHTMNHKNHIPGIVMQICPWSGPSISSVNRNYFYTCKVRTINIRVNTIINHPRATAASELFSMTHKDANSYAVCPVHHCNAPWLVVDSLFILRALLFHCMQCKMGSLALNMRMWKMAILGKMVVDIVGRKPQTILTISR